MVEVMMIHRQWFLCCCLVTCTLIGLSLTNPGPRAKAVKLIAKDANGNPTNSMTPNQDTTLNCTFDSDDAVLLVMRNGTRKPIYSYDFLKDEEQIWPDFQNRVSNIRKYKGAISFDLHVPYCHRDGVVECEMVYWPGGAYSDKNDFPIGMIRKPKMYFNGQHVECGSTVEGEEFTGVECLVDGIAPQARFTWVNCEQQEENRVEDMNCLFWQTSNADCLNTGDIECTVANSIGSEKCAIQISSPGNPVKLNA